MTDKDLITAFTNELTIDRTSENIGAAWLRKGAGPAAVESCAPFWFTGPENALRSQFCESLGKAKERVFISSSSLSEPTVLQALSSAVQRGVRTYIFLDKVGFEEVLSNTIASPLHGTALIRERESRGMDVALCDWHLPNKWGMVLSCPLDLTISSSAGGWAMELDGEQIDEMQRHMTHEFWSTEGTREVLAAEEVSHPPKVAEPPFVLKPLLNGALVCRSRYSTEGHEAPSEDIFRAMKKWDRLSNGKSTQQSVVLKGQLVDITGKAGVSLYSTPEQCKPFSGAYAHSGASLLLASGKRTFIAGWDRGAESDWGSLLMLNDDQAAVAEEWFEQQLNEAQWAGNDDLAIGNIDDEIIWKGRRMTVTDGQEVDLGIITLENMPRSEEDLKTFKPSFELPMDQLARSCTMHWKVSPPTLPTSASKDPLHEEWDKAKQVVSDRLSTLDDLNQPPKIALFGRKIKTLQTKLDKAIGEVDSIRDVKTLVKMKDDVETLTQDIMANAKAMDDAEVEAELEKAKEAQLKTHQAGVEKAKKSAEQFEMKLKPLNDEHAALTKQLSKSKKDEEKTRIKTDLETLERSIAGVESDLAKAVQESEAPFVFKPPKEKTGKKKTAGHLFVSKKDGQLLPLTVPSEDLPETGTLYVADNERCLGIVRWSELELATKEAKRLKASIAVMEGTS